MWHPRAGYTMIELMTSIAIAVMFGLGVNKVFQIAGDTVGTGSAYAETTRANLAAQSVFNDDAQGFVLPPAAPFLIIRSETIPAYRNAADEQGDRDYDPAITSHAEATRRVRTVDLDLSGTEGDAGVPGETVPRTALHWRNHRIDQLTFFARGSFPRQTGNDGTYAADMRCDEAMIWYGHLKQPNAAGDLTDARNPGLQSLNWKDSSSLPETRATNPNNFYATDWVLGRVAILLREPMGGKNGVILDNRGVPQIYMQRGGKVGDDSLGPLAEQSFASEASSRDSPVAATNVYRMLWSRYDLAGTSIDGFRRILADAIPAGRANNWFEAAGLCYRFAGYPYPSRPLSSTGYARTVPVFLPHCTQFAVEYAGDFVTQAADGTVAAVAEDAQGFAVPAPDGVIDFYVRPDGGRAIRWYGYPRDLNGDGVIQGNRLKNNDMPDVVPLRDVARAPFRFERKLNQTNDSDLPPKADYAAATGVALDARYLCAWGPDTVDCPVPKMIRLTLTLDDPRGRLPPEGRTFEYVLSLP